MQGPALLRLLPPLRGPQRREIDLLEERPVTGHLQKSVPGNLIRIEDQTSVPPDAEEGILARLDTLRPQDQQRIQDATLMHACQHAGLVTGEQRARKDQKVAVAGHSPPDAVAEPAQPLPGFAFRTQLHQPLVLPQRVPLTRGCDGRRIDRLSRAEACLPHSPQELPRMVEDPEPRVRCIQDDDLILRQQAVQRSMEDCSRIALFPGSHPGQEAKVVQGRDGRDVRGGGEVVGGVPAGDACEEEEEECSYESAAAPFPQPINRLR